MKKIIYNNFALLNLFFLSACFLKPKAIYRGEVVIKDLIINRANLNENISKYWQDDIFALCCSFSYDQFNQKKGTIYFTPAMSGDYFLSISEIGCGAKQFITTDWQVIPKKGVVPGKVYVEELGLNSNHYYNDNYGTLIDQVTLDKDLTYKLTLTLNENSKYDETWLDSNKETNIYLTITNPLTNKSYKEGNKEEIEHYSQEEFAYEN